MSATYPTLNLQLTARNSLSLQLQSGAAGPKGEPGTGVPVGGTVGQFLQKSGAGDFVTTWASPGTLSDGDKGDITVSGGGAVWTIDNKSALTKVDDTNVTLTLGGTPTTALLAPASLTLGWTGTLAVSRGGTGAGTLTNHGVLLGQGTGAIVATAVMTDGQLLVGQTGADPLPKTISGDLTVSAAGAMTIANDAVTNAKLANMAAGTYKMRVTASTGDPEDATATQATAGLNAMVGDSGSGGTKGLVPAPAAGDATRFLRGDGTWVTPAGSGDVSGPGASVTDNAAVRWNGTTGTIVQNSALIVADTTGALTRNGNGGIPLQGTNTNDSAGAGFVGEYVSSVVASGAAISLTNGVAADVTSISLTAGDWDVYGDVNFTSAASTSIASLIGSISQTSATTDLAAGNFNRFPFAGSGEVPGSGFLTTTVGPSRKSLSSTTTIYLVANAGFAVSTMSAWGILRARRVR